MAENPPGPAKNETKSTWSIVVAVGATIAALVPFLVAISLQAGRRTVSFGDMALTDVAVRDVWSSHIPLVGVYSRLNWYHPGPAMYYALAPFSWVTGNASWALVVGGICIQMVAIVWSARLAWRSGGAWLVLVVTLIQLLGYVAIRNFYPMTYAWNPLIAYPFLVLFGLQVWRVGLGEYVRLPGALGVGWFLVQTHVGYATLVATGVIWMIWAWRRQRSEAIDGWRHWWRWGLVVTAVMWLPTLLEAVTKGSDSNLVSLMRYVLPNQSPPPLADALTDVDSNLGFGRAVRLMGVEFHLWPSWLGGRVEPPGELLAKFEASGFWLLLPIVLLTAAYLVARRANERSSRQAVGLVSVMGLVGLVTLATVRGGAGSFGFFWRTSLAVAVCLVPLAVLIASSSAWRSERIRQAAGAALLAVILLTSIALTTQLQNGVDDAKSFGGIVTRLTNRVGDQYDNENIILQGKIDWVGAIYNELDRRGLHVTVGPDLARYRFGGRHAGNLSQADSVWVVGVGYSLSYLTSLPGARVVATSSPLTVSQEAQLRRLQIKLIQRFKEQGRGDDFTNLDRDNRQLGLDGLTPSDSADANAVAQLNASVVKQRDLRIGIVAFPPGPAPLQYSL